jgi:hypothetical protein
MVMSTVAADAVALQRLDRAVYAFARSYVLSLGVEEGDLERQLSTPVAGPRPVHMSEVYARLVASAQNSQSMPRVIGGSIGGVDKLGTVLFGFEPTEVVRK